MKRSLLVTVVLVGALAALAPAPALAATTYYANPAGSGEACSSTAPCAVKKAVELAQDGDAVTLQPGAYSLMSLEVMKAIDFGGETGGAATTTLVLSGGLTENNAGARFHDLAVEGTLTLYAGLAERLFVSSAGTFTACQVDGSGGGTLRDSVCWMHGAGPGGNAINVELLAPTGSATLANDDAITTTPSGDGIYVLAFAGKYLSLTMTNTIARGAKADVYLEPFSSTSRIEAQVRNSNYTTITSTIPAAAPTTDPGSAGNQTADPGFANPAAGDFHETTSSPTIDAGLTDPANGTLALGGEARAIGSCAGSSGATDIGAYEFVPTAACPKPAPAPTPLLNKFKVGKLKKNKKRGTGVLLVTVPGPGQFTLFGKGVRKAVRSSHGSEVLKLPVKPLGKAKKGLAKNGKLKLGLKLKFVPTGGSAALLTKKVTLKEKLPSPR